MSLRPALLALAVAAAFSAAPASAYPWMINHNYGACAACHVDPSGAGQLTEYGRAIGESVVRWYADPHALDSGETPYANLLPQPEWLNVGMNLRGGAMVVASDAGNVSTRPSTSAFPLVMASDLYGTVNFGPFVAHASLGYGYKQAGEAAVIAGDPATGDNALVSREHWAGMRFLDDGMLIRAGRINMPFGLRNNEHVSFVRAATRTDANTDQQHGIAVSWSGETVRAEVLSVLGNYQVHPDDYRERGYSALVEWLPMERVAVGASSLVTYASRDAALPTSDVVRQAHGLFARVATDEHLALLIEGDLISRDLPTAGRNALGGVGWAQVDWQPMQGVHVMPAVETLFVGDGSESLPALGGWASVAWYPLPHTELRTDLNWRERFPSSGNASGAFTGLMQLHFYL